MGLCASSSTSRFEPEKQTLKKMKGNIEGISDISFRKSWLPNTWITQIKLKISKNKTYGIKNFIKLNELEDQYSLRQKFVLEIYPSFPKEKIKFTHFQTFIQSLSQYLQLSPPNIQEYEEFKDNFQCQNCDREAIDITIKQIFMNISDVMYGCIDQSDLFT